MTAAPVLRVEDLTVRFTRRNTDVAAVNGVDFSLKAGETLTILGESGSGKSVSLKALMGLLPTYAGVSGKVWLNGQEILGLPAAALAKLRGGAVSMIFQEPMAALDPVYTIGEQIAETIIQHEGCDTRTAMLRALGLLEQVKIPSAERRLKNFPHEMSGGMRQRAMIALALACKPSCAAGRRTNHGAGRHRADPDPAAAAPVAGGTRHGDRVRYPRRRRGRRDLRSHRGHVRRPLRRDRHHPRGDAPSAAPVYTRVAGIDRSWRHAWPRAGNHSRQPAQSGGTAAGVPLRAALPICHGCMPTRRNPCRHE